MYPLFIILRQELVDIVIQCVSWFLEVWEKGKQAQNLGLYNLRDFEIS